MKLIGKKYKIFKLYWMVKDKITDGNRNTLYQNPKYTLEQKLENESSLKNLYIHDTISLF